LSYFKKYSHDYSLIVADFDINVNENTFVHIKDCAIICVYNVSRIGIYDKNGLLIEFSNEPDRELLEHLAEKYPENRILSNLNIKNQTPVNIYEHDYYPLEMA